VFSGNARYIVTNSVISSYISIVHLSEEMAQKFVDSLGGTCYQRGMLSPLDDESCGPFIGSEKAVAFVPQRRCASSQA
jgi:hypothetical protein